MASKRWESFQLFNKFYICYRQKGSHLKKITDRVMVLRHRIQKYMFIFVLIPIFSNALSDCMGFAFLNRSYSPRTSALAGSSVALDNDFNNILANPAGLASLNSIQSCLNYTNHLLDMSGSMVGI